MSITKLREALAKIQGQDDANFFGAQDEAIIEEAERRLGLVFPADYREFVATCGTGSFRGLEIYGLAGRVEGDAIPNIVWYTMSCRARGMPLDLLPVDFSEVGSPCIRVKNGSTSFPVVTYYDHYPIEAQSFEILADSFGAFLLEEVEERLTWDR